MTILGRKAGSILCKTDPTIADCVPAVECFADLSLPLPAGIAAGERYIAINVSTPHGTWINLPLGLQENDIIEKDYQNLNWILDLDISEVDKKCKPVVHVNCKGYLYWWNCFDWVEISPCNFGGYLYNQDLCVTTNGQTIFSLSNSSQNPERTILKVNGIVVNYPAEYIIDGTTVTWLNTTYELSLTDCLQILYC